MISQKALINAASIVRSSAYAPYSSYQVGAAVLGENGKIYVGCNVENASYGLTICAERNAISQMIADGCQTAIAVAIVTENGGSPCGACRQVLNEFADDLPIYLADDQGKTHQTTLTTLLPDSFGPLQLSLSIE